MTEAVLEIWPGRPQPLGATWDGQGVNFAVFSEWAERIEVCLFDPAQPARQTQRFTLPVTTHGVRHGYLPRLPLGTLYGLRAHGPWAPERGLRFNPAKLLLDPYARSITGRPDLSHSAHVRNEGSDDLVLDPTDSADATPRAVVVDHGFDWEGDRPPRTPWTRSIVYELHVRGFTRRHPEVPPELRGTYGGLVHPAPIAHLKSLGVTAVELLPVHQAADEGFLRARGLTNYWGYNTIGFFAPDVAHACSGALNVVNEFKGMVKGLHRAGIEVILDVVYNHTAEGDHQGPTLCFRGLDNPTYYRLKPDNPRYYVDVAGTGNTLNFDHPQTLKFALDSLRYWVQEMHVDGFRFDLAVALGRQGGTFSRRAAFFQAVHQDPVLSQVKLIAEPWDLGPGGYQQGNFPVAFSEWNGKYRDAFRRYWKGDDNLAAEIGYRLTGSSDLFQLSGRGPTASINFITSHDGFTLHDLVTYQAKHNEANGEGNRDGSDDNNSWNCGVEGETDDPPVRALRDRMMRNFLATLFLSQGVPMLLAGDEMGRTQGGNNNAYCQDNEVSWLEWELDDWRRSLLAFTRLLIQTRLSEPVLARRDFFQGHHIFDSQLKDVAWFRPDGAEMLQEDWQKPVLRSFGFLLGGDAIGEVDERGRRLSGDTLLILLNADQKAVPFVIPALEWGRDWEFLLDTSDGRGPGPSGYHAGGTVTVADRALLVLRRTASAPSTGSQP
ncbi:MAG TPA: glycogen debranching protein GlgX [Myxococcaceae bacterium]|jgi:glycogen operon protein|nr:glycogen debranching protein GlgX [Myxococcaceae bacterium]